MLPLFHYNNIFYSLNDSYELITLREDDFQENSEYIIYRDLDIFYETLLQKITIYDVEFFEFLLYCQENKKAEFSVQIVYIEKYKELLKQLKQSFDTSHIKNCLILLKKISLVDRIKLLLDKYKDYYINTNEKILYNVNHYNSQHIRLKEQYDKELYESKYIENLIDTTYFNVQAKFYNILSSRVSINTARFSDKHKQFLEPSNDIIVEVDSLASEFRFLLFVSGELQKYSELDDKNSFWKTISKLLNAGLFEQDMKMFMYLRLYGYSKDRLAKKFTLSHDHVNRIYSMFEQVFPETNKFISLNSQSNKYISKNSEIVYDYFNKEIYCKEEYKRLNYFMQSSLSTLFQLTTNKIIKELKKNKLKSKLLYTIHDAFVLDLCMDEKKDVFAIIKNNSELNGFNLVYKIKNINK